MDYIQLVAVFGDGSTCLSSLQSRSSCSTDCSNSIRMGVDNYGCCINVPIRYVDATDPENDVNADADLLFSACGVSWPEDCSATALGPPGTQVNPPVNPPSNPPPNPPRIQVNGAGQTIAVAAVLLLNSLIAAFMHL